MYVHHKGTYPVFDFDLFINYCWSKRDTYLFPGFQLAVRNYVKYIDYLLTILKCQCTICKRLWELEGMHFFFLLV